MQAMLECLGRTANKCVAVMQDVPNNMQEKHAIAINWNEQHLRVQAKRVIKRGAQLYKYTEQTVCGKGT